MGQRLRRKPDWVLRLKKATEAAATRPYRWGTHDCCMGPCALVRVITGTHPAPHLRGYRTARGAALKLARAARGVPAERRLEAVAEAIARDFNAREVPVARAQRGDLVLIEAETQEGRKDVLAVVDLSGRFVITPAKRGWGRLPIEQARRAWRIG